MMMERFQFFPEISSDAAVVTTGMSWPDFATDRPVLPSPWPTRGTSVLVCHSSLPLPILTTF